MKTATLNVIETLLAGDPTATPFQRESILAIAEGEAPPAESLMLKQHEVALLCNRTRQWVWNATKKGFLHPVIIDGGHPLFKRSEVLKFLEVA